MGDFDPAFVHALAVQSWSLYSVGMLLIGMRTYARIHRMGIRGLQTDDYLMLWAGGLYTALIVCLNVICTGGGSNLYPPEQFETFTEENIQDRIHGSKIVIVSEQAMLNVIYTIKACMLIMYSRLTLGLQVQRSVFYLGIYVAIGWFATEIAFFTACTPFSGYWAMPPPNPQCTTLEHYAIIQACFNISSDALMLCIPIPLITKLNVPLKQKSVLLLIFSMGFFVIFAAILTKVFNLANVWDPSYMLWYIRESSVAVYVSNLPMIWPLMREWFPVLKTLGPAHKSSSRANGSSSRPHNISGRHISGGFIGKRINTNGVITTIRGKGESTEELSGGSEDVELGTIASTDSSDGSFPNGISDKAWEGHRHEIEGGGIHVTKTTTVEVSEEHVAGPRSRIANPLPIAGPGGRRKSGWDVETFGPGR